LIGGPGRGQAGASATFPVGRTSHSPSTTAVSPTAAASRSRSPAHCTLPSPPRSSSSGTPSARSPPAGAPVRHGCSSARPWVSPGTAAAFPRRGAVPTHSATEGSSNRGCPSAATAPGGCGKSKTGRWRTRRRSRPSPRRTVSGSRRAIRTVGARGGLYSLRGQPCRWDLGPQRDQRNRVGPRSSWPAPGRADPISVV